MAGVNSQPKVTGQLQLIAGLRWRVFVNSLRTAKGKADLAGRILHGASMAFIVLSVGAGLAFGSWAAFHHHRSAILAGELWIVFAVWQFFPIFFSSFGRHGDATILLRFPLSYAAFFTLILADGLLDPVAIVAIFWLGMMLIGAGVAITASIPSALLGFGAFAAVNLLLSCAVFTWLDRWLAQRRTREILGAIFFVLIIGIQFIQPVSERWGKEVSGAVRHFALVEKALPPGLTLRVIEGFQAGGSDRAIAGLVGLGLVGLVLAWALGIRLRAQFRGESLSETPREVTVTTKTVHQGWDIGGLSPTVAALLEKDLRYMLRNTGQYFSLIVPLVLVVVFGLQRQASSGFHIMPLAGSDFFFPIAVAYCLLIVIGPAYNSLGYEGPGILMLFAAPVRFRDVLLAKNLLHTLVFATEVGLVLLGSMFVGAKFSPAIVALTLAAALFSFPANLAVGNVVSLHFPRRMQFGAIRRQKAAGMTMLINLGSVGATIGLSAGIFAISIWFHKAWIAGVVFIVLASITFFLYRKVLQDSSGIADRCRETLVRELCRQ